MKPFIILTSFTVLFSGFAIAPAKAEEREDEHEEREHHGDGEHKKREGENHQRDRESKKGEGERKQGGNKNAGAENLPPASTREGITFAKDIAPIFEDACVRCHGEDKKKAKLRVDTLEELMKGSEDGAVVIPGQSAKSPLVLSVARVDRETAMPPDRKPGKDVGPDGKKLPPVVHFTPEQVGLIRAWIDQGAK